MIMVNLASSCRELNHRSGRTINPRPPTSAACQHEFAGRGLLSAALACSPLYQYSTTGYSHEADTCQGE